MKQISNFLLFLFIFFNNLFTLENDLSSFLDNLLQSDIDFQKKENRLNTLKAKNKIDKTINLFDINLAYSKTLNELTREQEEKQISELSEINEEVDRWWIELNKTLFEKDFDNIYDLLNAKIEITCREFELDIYRIKRIDEIIENFLEWKRAGTLLNISCEQLEILNRENKILEKLFEKNVIEPDELIENLSEIKKKEKEANKLKEVISGYNKTFKNCIPEFFLKFEHFTQIANIKADTIAFKEKNANSLALLKHLKKKTLTVIRRKIYYFYLPEMKLSLSYHKKNTFQDWEITEGSEFYLRERNYRELYPEAGIEFSIPLNFWGNASGKYFLIKSLERKVFTDFADSETKLLQFENEILSEYLIAAEDLEMQKEIFELQKIKFERIKKKYKTQPLLLGKNPEIAFKKEEFIFRKAKLELDLLKMELFKKIFLINYFAEI